MSDEWGLHARGMKSTADHWVNRNACCLPVCSWTEASQTLTDTHAPLISLGAWYLYGHGTCIGLEAKLQEAPQGCELSPVRSIATVGDWSIATFPSAKVTLKKNISCRPDPDSECTSELEIKSGSIMYYSCSLNDALVCQVELHLDCLSWQCVWCFACTASEKNGKQFRFFIFSK